MKKLLTVVIIIVAGPRVFAQSDRWQQRIAYNIDVKMDVVSNRFSGKENITYFNNSPDTLTRIFFHTYWNAFQPNSSMDINSRVHGNIVLRQDKEGKDIKDWDPRVKDRIANLQPNEIGIQKVNEVMVNGIKQPLKEHETILEVVLNKPILPKSKALISVVFEAQVPLQIRRSGRDNKEGVRYSMSQWYPKLAEYDYTGWNINPYIAREFYGVWGDFDVKINIDSNYKVAATGVQQKLVGDPKNIWRFSGKNIHDFVWAADQNYVHLSKKARPDLILNIYYIPKDASTDSAWQNVLWAAEKVLPYIEKRFGKYPWPQYSFIQGGDGGMEYAMATLVKGPGLGTAFHEWLHSWYQQLMGSNEYLYPWLDEGFTDFADSEVMDYYLNNWANQSPYISEAAKIANTKQVAERITKFPLRQADSYRGYFTLIKSGFAEAMSTPSDFYATNYAYSTNAYSKGSMFLTQLGYIVSDSIRDLIMLEYYNQWKFKHPNPNDFVRIAEKLSGLKLDWYKDYWLNTNKTINYSVDSLWEAEGITNVRIRRLGEMPMPVDVQLSFKDGTKELHYIPLDLMYGSKPTENGISTKLYAEWKWVDPTYILSTSRKILDISTVEIDPTQRLADIDQRNNFLKIKW